MKSADRLLRMPTVVLLSVFTLADIVAGGLYALYLKGVLTSRFFRLDRDRGVAELIQYGKFGLTILMLVRWNRVRRSKLLTAWVILFAVMLADDSIGLHEEIGGWLMRVIDFPSFEGFRVKDVAEAFIFAMLEGTACVYVAMRYLQAPRDLRAYSRRLALAMVPLVLTGLVLDVLPYHELEQRGEMVAMSILLGFVHWQYRLSMKDGVSNNADSHALPDMSRRSAKTERQPLAAQRTES